MEPVGERDLATFHRRKSGGHYARVMGTLHRHQKTEKAGDAALGMLVRIWSYCADTGRSLLTDRDMAVIMVRDKNGPRKLRQLIDARLLDRAEGGYAPHDWFDHNPGLKQSEPKVDNDNSSERESNVRDGESNVTLNVTRNVRKSRQQNQQLETPLSRPKTQDNKNTDIVDEVFVHWARVMGKDMSRTKLNAARRAKLKARRQEGYTDEQLCLAVDGCKASPFHMGKNDRGQVYDDLVTILRDGPAVEAHIARVAPKTAPVRVAFAGPLP